MKLVSETKFPLWRNPEWKDEYGKSSPLNDVCEEYFDKNGKLGGLIQPYGTIWAAIVTSGGEYRLDNNPHPNWIVIGHFYTKQQAKIAVEGANSPLKYK